MSGALIPVSSCRVCALPYRFELEGLLASGMSFAGVSLLAGREPPIPARDELAAHAAGGHLLPASVRAHQALTGRTIPRDPVGALELSVAALSARIATGDLSHISSMPALASALARVQEPAAREAESQTAFTLAIETAHRLCQALAPVLGPEGARQLRLAYSSALREAIAEQRQSGATVARTPPVAFADAAGLPWAAWDRARLQALREEIGDEVIWQRLLARMAADPARFYPPWPSDQVAL